MVRVTCVPAATLLVGAPEIEQPLGAPLGVDPWQVSVLDAELHATVPEQPKPLRVIV
jgi:hypothetical protein